MGNDPDRPRPGRLWLRNRYRVHQRLCMAFPSAERKERDPSFLKPFDPDGFQHVHGARTEDQAFLFRVDPLPGGRAMIVVQSGREPDWDYAFHNARHLLAACPVTRPFDPHFPNGQSLRFRLLVNPIRKIDTKTGADGKRRQGKRVPVPTDRLDDWLRQRAESAGFRVERLISVQAGYLYMQRDFTDEKQESTDDAKEIKGIRLRSARYDGILEVTNGDLFRNALMHGIGPAKAFGFGLLSVAPLPGEEI